MAVTQVLASGVDIIYFNLPPWSFLGALHISEGTGDSQGFDSSDMLWGGRMILRAHNTLQGDGHMTATQAHLTLRHTLKIPYIRLGQRIQLTGGQSKEAIPGGYRWSIELDDLTEITAYDVGSDSLGIVTFSSLTANHNLYNYKFIEIDGRTFFVTGVNVAENKMQIFPHIEGHIELNTTPVERAESAIYIKMTNTEPPDMPEDEFGMGSVEFDFIESQQGPVDTNTQATLTTPMTPKTSNLFTEWNGQFINWSP